MIVEFFEVVVGGFRSFHVLVTTLFKLRNEEQMFEFLLHSEI